MRMPKRVHTRLEDAARLLELLDHPRPPNARLKLALDAYRKLTGGDLGRPFELPPRMSGR